MHIALTEFSHACKYVIAPELLLNPILHACSIGFNTKCNAPCKDTVHAGTDYSLHSSLRRLEYYMHPL